MTEKYHLEPLFGKKPNKEQNNSLTPEKIKSNNEYYCIDFRSRYAKRISELADEPYDDKKKLKFKCVDDSNKV